MRNIGFIGLGRMGGPMALHLLESVERLHVFDVAESAVAPLQAAGATRCTSAAELAAVCDVIMLCLPSTAEVREALFCADGIAGHAADGLTVLDATTLDRGDALAIAEESRKAGITYCDCPVSGMPLRAEVGTLTTMFGGDAGAFEAARPLLESFSASVIHCGPLGSGQAMKAVNNILYDINIVALCEVLPLAVAAGLDADALETVVTTASSSSFASKYFVPRMMDRAFDSDFAMEDAWKDIVNVEGMAAETGASLPLVEAMTARYRAAMDAGYGREPKSAIIKLYEQALGVTFERKGEG